MPAGLLAAPAPVPAPGRERAAAVPPGGGRRAPVHALQGTDSVRESSRGSVLPLVCAPFGMTDGSVQNVACACDPTTTTVRPDDLRVRPAEYGTATEVTASERAAVGRLALDPPHRTGRLAFDLAGDARLRMSGNRAWGDAEHHGGPAAGDFHGYFAAVLDRPAAGGKTVGTETEPGEGAGCVEFATEAGKPLETRIATSFIGPEQARANLDRETADGLEGVRESTAAAWEGLLGRIAVEGSPERNLCNIPLMPASGSVDPADYDSPFSHGNEEAHPGYYRVFLQRYGVDAELTSTLRCAYHKYTFKPGADERLIADLGVSSERVRGWEAHRDFVGLVRERFQSVK